MSLSTFDLSTITNLYKAIFRDVDVLGIEKPSKQMLQKLVELYPYFMQYADRIGKHENSRLSITSNQFIVSLGLHEIIAIPRGRELILTPYSFYSGLPYRDNSSIEYIVNAPTIWKAIENPKLFALVSLFPALPEPSPETFENIAKLLRDEALLDIAKILETLTEHAGGRVYLYPRRREIVVFATRNGTILNLIPLNPLSTQAASAAARIAKLFAEHGYNSLIVTTPEDEIVIVPISNRLRPLIVYTPSAQGQIDILENVESESMYDTYRKLLSKFLEKAAKLGKREHIMHAFQVALATAYAIPFRVPIEEASLSSEEKELLDLVLRGLENKS